MKTNSLEPTGIHHLTAITAKASLNHAFYTRILGMRLVKKTVNQDDVSAYHLFYADGKGTPGTDLTFFDWPAAPERRGTDSIVRTGLRVPGEDSIHWWGSRFREQGVSASEPETRDGRWCLDFEDPEGQRLCLVADPDSGVGHPWENSPVPPEHQILGLGPVTISIRDFAPTDLILTNLLNMRRVREWPASGSRAEMHVYAMGGDGPSAELQVLVEPAADPARQGAGGVHHVAFRVPTFDQYEAWNRRLHDYRIPSSGPVDRFYFRSLYFRDRSGILFELATDEPGFSVDEPEESLGENLALPPFLESRRKEIEANLKPLS